MPFRHMAGPVVVNSSRPSEPCTTQARSAPSRPKTSAIGSHPMSGKDADHLASGAGGIGQGPSRLNMVRMPSSTRTAATWRMAVWWRGAIRKPILFSHRHSPNQAGVGVDLDAERGQHVGRAGFRRQGAVAVLGHRNAASGDHQRRGGRDIDRCPRRRRRCRRCRWRPAAPRSAWPWRA